MIYFNNKKQAYGFEIANPIAVIDDETWSKYAGTDKWDIIDGEFIDISDTEEYKAKQSKQERERLDKLSMTRGDVFEALILAKGLGKAQIRAMIEQAELDTVTKALYLNRFDEALEFYRGYPIFDMLGQVLGITGEMLDKFFETKDYHELITKEVENENTTDTEQPTNVSNEVETKATDEPNAN